MEVTVELKAHNADCDKSHIQKNIATIDKLIDKGKLSISEEVSLMATKSILVGIKEQLPNPKGDPR